MIPRVRLEAALSPVAQAFLSKFIDPAEAWLAEHDGLTPAQARSRARNAARSLGKSWPDHLPPSALIDPAEALEIQQKCGLYGLSPLEILEAVEQAEMALGGPAAALRLAAADVRDVDTQAMSAACGITRRRAQQIKRERVDLAERQFSLFCGEDEEGGEE